MREPLIIYSKHILQIQDVQNIVFVKKIYGTRKYDFEDKTI